MTLGLERTQRVAILSLGLNTNPKTRRACLSTLTPPQIRSHTNSHTRAQSCQPTYPKAHTRSQLPGPLVQCHTGRAQTPAQKQPRYLQDLRSQKATQTHAGHTRYHTAPDTDARSHRPSELTCMSHACAPTKHPSGPPESHADTQGHAHRLTKCTQCLTCHPPPPPS